jgi:CMP-N-acetylneuraminic acid synthetase
MWRHAWLACEAHLDRTFEVSILLEPTSPLRRAEDVTRVMAAMIEGGHAAAVSISRTPGHFTPHKTLTVDSDGRVDFYLPDGARFTLRQNIPAYFHRNGVCYAVRRSTLVDQGTIIEHDCAAVLIERHIVNIDDMLDLRVANLLADEGPGAAG